LLEPLEMVRISSSYKELWYSECLRGRGKAIGRGAGILGIRVWFLFCDFWDRVDAGSISSVVPWQWRL
jgi:hypothetical protein